jgi:hypothetical protein
MKKTILFLFILTIAFVSCNSDDDSNNNQTEHQLNPPQWIQATWTKTEAGITTGYQFTDNDMLTIVGANSVSLKASLTDTDQVLENSTDSSYQFTITHTATNNSTESWEFNKAGTTQLQATHGNVTVILNKQ